MSGPELAALVDRLVRQVAHWQAPRWAAPLHGAAGHSRGDAFHELVQRIADLAADAEGQPRRPVPRLDTDLALPDQLRVVAADLLAAGPSPAQVTAATAHLTTLRAAL